MYHWITLLATTFITHRGLYALIGVVVVATVMKLISLASASRREADYAYLALELIHQSLNAKLGDKGETVYEIWLESLKALETTLHDEDELVDSFARYIKTSMKERGISLCAVEVGAVRDAIKTAVTMVYIDSKSMQQAVAKVLAQRSA